MNIFENLVPLVAFYAPTGKEKHLGSGVIEPSQFGHSAKFDSGKSLHIPTGQDLVTNVGDTFKSAKAIELAKTHYTRNSKGELIIAEPKPDAQRIWRVVELYK